MWRLPDPAVPQITRDIRSNLVRAEAPDRTRRGSRKASFAGREHSKGFEYFLRVNRDGLRKGDSPTLIRCLRRIVELFKVLTHGLEFLLRSKELTF